MITAIIADALLILLAIVGISALIFTVAWLKTLILMIGACFLLYIGWSIWKITPRFKEKGQRLSAKQQISFTLSISLLNPHSLVDTIGVIGTNSLYFEGNEKLAYITACIIVSIFWFTGLAIAGHKLHRLDKKGTWFIIINKISALSIWAIAVYMIFHLLYK